MEKAVETKKRKKKKNRKNSVKGLSNSNLRRVMRKRRRRIAMIRRMTVAAAVVAVAGVGFAIIWNLPAVKLNRALSSADNYVEAAAYEEAIESYEDALQIDSASVKAYRNMAVTYLDMEESSQAKQVLYKGWENTHDEGLMKYYCTLILNEGVAEINSEECTFETVQKFLTVLEQDAGNADALSLMDTAYIWMRDKVGSEPDYFYDGDLAAETCNFSLYQDVMSRLIKLGESTGSETIGQLASKFAVFSAAQMRISRHHLGDYKELLYKVLTLPGAEGVTELVSCLEKEAEIADTFAGVFAEFDAGNMEAAKDFIVTDTYTEIRDQFINKEMEYWKGETYIPVSRETVILRFTDGIWTFEYPAFADQENTAGIITVYGNKMTDEGIQRSCIAYEPAKTSESYYPHTEYVVSYMFSNVQKKSKFEAQMNYHLETRVWTQEEMTTEMIGDWGGSYEWTKTY